MKQNNQSHFIQTELLIAHLNSILKEDSRFSRQSGRLYYKSYDFPRILEEYSYRFIGSNKTNIARYFGISRSSLERILSGYDISENMILRIKTRLEKACSEYGYTQQGWKLTNSEAVQDSISKVALSLTALHHALLESNRIGSSESAIGPLQKAQLIALLEAMLAALKAPAIDTKATSGFFSWLRKIAIRGAEKGLETGISDTLGEAIDSGGKLLTELASQTPIADLDILV